MRSPNAALWPGLALAGGVFAAGSPTAAAPPAALAADNAASSVWDTDPTKVGIELQIVNHGGPADDVRVTSVAVQGGAFSGALVPPIALGNIAPQASALLDLVITVLRTDETGYLLTISGTYRNAGATQPFSLTRTVSPSAAAPAPVAGHSGISAKGSVQPSAPVQPPAAGGQPLFGPNATTPMLIPPGPPRQLSLPNPDGTGRPTQQR
jgi:hypothetical protein